MSAGISDERAAMLREAGQAHVLDALAGLEGVARSELADDLGRLDARTLGTMLGLARQDAPPPAAAEPGPVLELESASFPYRYHHDAEDARAVGASLLAAGKVACVLVAGGQGTRLGFDQPKGLYPIWPLSGRTLFDGFAGQLRAAAKRFGVQPPLFVMTSAETHEATVEAFSRHGYWGLAPGRVFFFQQGALPALGTDGRLLLASPSRLAVAPDGHGGCVRALAEGGHLARMAELGCEWISYFQVDNPAVTVCDTAFIGLAARNHSDACLKVVRKIDPAEKVGVFGLRAGRAAVIEYSELPAADAARRATDGGLAYRGGSIAVHVFRRAFLERVAATPDGLPLHRAFKKVAHWDGTGIVEPAAPNAFKFERFIFDVLPEAENVFALEVPRSAEFLPVKESAGTYSPDAIRAAMQSEWRDVLRRAGFTVADTAKVEIAPELWGARDVLAHHLDSHRAGIGALLARGGAVIAAE
jgi:UDP-N-acetylglucosamine/UDP-N-acetylgalactosamine diphosphorylase